MKTEDVSAFRHLTSTHQSERAVREKEIKGYLAANNNSSRTQYPPIIIPRYNKENWPTSVYYAL